MFFPTIFNKGGQLLGLPVCFPGTQNSSKIGSTLKAKNLLLLEQILPFKSGPLLRKKAKEDWNGRWSCFPRKHTHPPKDIFSYGTAHVMYFPLGLSIMVGIVTKINII